MKFLKLKITLAYIICCIYLNPLFCQKNLSNITKEKANVASYENITNQKKVSLWQVWNKLGKGYSLGGWLEAIWLEANYPDRAAYTKDMLELFAELGFETIRLPISYEWIIDENPPYNTITNQEPFDLFETLIKPVAQQYDQMVILDNHHGKVLTNDNFRQEIPRLCGQWIFLTQYYKDLPYDQYLFEIRNELQNEISNDNLQIVHQAIIDSIRNYDTERILVVGANSWGAGTSLVEIEPYNDPNIIYTFQSFAPFNFTHQGMPWIVPQLPTGITFNEGDEGSIYIQNELEGVKQWSDNYNVPVLWGEFAVSWFADAQSRCNYIQYTTCLADELNIPWIYWDIKNSHDAFGIFEEGDIAADKVIPCFAEAMFSSACKEVSDRDLIENIRAGIPPSEIEENNIKTTKIYEDITNNWQSKDAIVMDVFDMTQLNKSLVDKYNEHLNDYVLLDLKTQELDYVYKQQPKDILMLIPVAENRYLELALSKTEVGAYGVSISNCLHYAGVVKGSSGTMAALTFTNNKVSVMIGDAFGNYLLNKTVDFENSYVLYNDKNLNIREGLRCGVTDSISGGQAKISNSNNINAEQRLVEERCVKIYFECDNHTFQTYNSNEDEVIFKVESTFNQVQLIYAEEGITLEIAEIFIHKERDPEYYEIDSGILLDNFEKRVRNNFPGNIAHLITTKNIGDGGLANIAGIHSLSALGFPDEQSPFSDYSRDVYLIAHEIGHNLGSHHTQACYWGIHGNEALDNCADPEKNYIIDLYEGYLCNPGPRPLNGGTIMSYCVLDTAIGVNFVIGFRKGPGDVIRQGAENLFCQKRGCTSPNACNYNSFADVEDDSCVTGFDSSLFNDNPWLRDEFNSEDCSESGVIEYEKNGHEYFYIFSPQEAYLIGPSNWESNCIDQSNYDCRKVNSLSRSNLTASSCVCEAPPCQTTETCNTNPCLEGGVKNWNTESCTCEIIEATKRGCSDPTACNYDSSVNCVDNSQCAYSPDCNINCNDISVYNNFPWLSTIANNTVCNFDKIIVYSDGNYRYIYVVSSNKGVIYRTSGNVWAKDYGDYYYVNWYIENADWFELTCLNCNAPPPFHIPDCSKNTGTFFYDDCGGTNYYFIRLTDGRVFDPYLSNEDLATIFPNGVTEGFQVNFDYVFKDPINPCNIQPIDITCIEPVPTCNDSIQNGDEEGIDCGGNNCDPCDSTTPTILPSIFEEYPELLDLVDPFNCNGETVMVYDYDTYVYIYMGINNVGALYYSGNSFCEDEPGSSCLSYYHLNYNNATATWSCGEMIANQSKTARTENKKMKQLSFTVYPNPSSGKVFIDFGEFDSTNSSLSIYDVSGKKVYNYKVDDTTNEKTIELNLTDLDKGIYIVELKNELSTQIEKLLIN